MCHQTLVQGLDTRLTVLEVGSKSGMVIQMKLIVSLCATYDVMQARNQWGLMSLDESPILASVLLELYISTSYKYYM